MLFFLTDILYFLSMFFILIFVHELGHLFVARLIKLRIKKFVIGFGKSLIQIKTNNIDYFLNIIPLGGFLATENLSRAKISFLKKFLFVFSGLIFNIFLAFFLFFIVNLSANDLLQSFVLTLKQVYFSILYVFSSIAFFVSGKINIESFSGPLGIFYLASLVSQRGFLNFLSLCAFASINMAVINLIPLPILDGGKFLMLLLERIFKKEISQKIKYHLNLISLFLIIIFMLYLTFKVDLKNL